MRRGANIFWVALLASFMLAACGQDKPLRAKLFNQGQYPLTGFYFQPAGTVPATGWETADWGRNHLPLPRLEQNQFVIVTTLERLTYDGRATFDVGGNVENLRGEVLANWIRDGEIITIFAGFSDSGTTFGYQWGEQHFPSEVDVTP
ncbi:MAG: hypothetical protein GYA21_12745 [Myxococcales bacterium]|nr:hypothetical protein [Myxococcales bacterium]